MPDAAAVVREWVAAVNARDPERLVALADPGFEVETPHGIEHGHDAIRAFIARQSYGVAQVIEPTEIFARGDIAVAAGRTELRSVETGETMHSFPSAIVLQLRDGLVSRLKLHDDAEAALADAGLNADDRSD